MRHVSFDGGETWDSAPLLGDVPPPALAGSLMMADPFVLFLSDGTALYSGMTSSFAESFDVFVARSPDGGLTWPEATIVAEEIGFWLPPGAGITVDQPFLAVGPGDVVLATWMYKYEGQGLADVGTAVSHDLGRTWSEPVLLTETTGNHGNARPVITDDGTMYITFQDRAIWDATPVWMARSDDNGTTWATWLVEGLAAADYMDLETFGNTLFTPYAEEDAERREHQFLLRSEDGGHTWTKQILTISPRPSHVGPALDVGPDGTAFVLHYVTGTDERPRVVASRVGPDGTLTNATVSGDEPLGEHRFEGFASWPIYGDYSGMIADEHGAIATWVGGNADNEDLLASFLELPSWKGGDRPPGLDEEPNRG